MIKKSNNILKITKNVFINVSMILIFYVKTSLARLFSERCPQNALRSVIGPGPINTRPVTGIQPVIGTLVDMNSDASISTTQRGTTIDLLTRELEHLKLKVYVSYFSYYKPITTCLSLQRDVPIFLA